MAVSSVYTSVTAAGVIRSDRSMHEQSNDVRSATWQVVSENHNLLGNCKQQELLMNHNPVLVSPNILPLYSNYASVFSLCLTSSDVLVLGCRVSRAMESLVYEPVCPSSFVYSASTR